MRKIAVLVALVMALSMGLVFAEVKSKIDSFDGSTSIVCFYDYSSAFGTSLIRSIEANKTEATFLFTDITATRLEGWYFFTELAQMKVDDNPEVYSLKVIKPAYKVDNGLLHSNGTIVITPETAEIIKKTNRISIRYFFDGKQPLTLTLPDKILQEWKQVLNYQK